MFVQVACSPESGVKKCSAAVTAFVGSGVERQLKQCDRDDQLRF